MRTRATIVLTLLAVLVGGCGGQSESERRAEYVGAVDRHRTELAAAFDRLADSTDAVGTPASDARTLLGYERALDVAATRIGALDPPGVAKSRHRELIVRLRAYARDLSGTRAALAGARPAVVPELRERLRADIVRDQAALDDAVAALNRALASPGD